MFPTWILTAKRDFSAAYSGDRRELVWVYFQAESRTPALQGYVGRGRLPDGRRPAGRYGLLRREGYRGAEEGPVHPDHQFGYARKPSPRREHHARGAELQPGRVAGTRSSTRDWRKRMAADRRIACGCRRGRGPGRCRFGRRARLPGRPASRDRDRPRRGICGPILFDWSTQRSRDSRSGCKEKRLVMTGMDAVHPAAVYVRPVDFLIMKNDNRYG